MKLHSYSICALLLAVALVIADDPPQEPVVRAVQPPNIKIYVSDTKLDASAGQEERQIEGNDKVQIAVPVAKIDEAHQVKIVDDSQTIVDDTAEKTKDRPFEIPSSMVQDENLARELPPFMLPTLPLINRIPMIINQLLGNAKLGLPNIQTEQNDQIVQQDQTAVSENNDQQSPHRIVSILLMKKNNFDQSDASSDPTNINDSPIGIKTSSFVIFKFLPNLLPISGDVASNDASSNSISNNNSDDENDDDDDDDDEDTKKAPAVPLLGGGGEDDVDRKRIQFMIPFGNDALIANNQDSSSMNMHHNPENLFFRIKSFFENLEQPPESSDEQDQQDQQEPKKKCMMFGFIRFKTAKHHKIIMNLLFFSGILLFVLFMILLTMRSYKRRRALRYYAAQNMNVATIDGASDKLAKENRRNEGFISRLVIFRNNRSNNYADKQQDCMSSVLIQSPPAYDQVIINDKTSSLTSVSKPVAKVTFMNSLAQAYKNKIESRKSSSDNEDTKSMSSLPDYEQLTKKDDEKPEKQDQI